MKEEEKEGGREEGRERGKAEIKYIKARKCGKRDGTSRDPSFVFSGEVA